MAAKAPVQMKSLGVPFSRDRWNKRTARKKKKAGAISVFANPDKAAKVGLKAQRKRTAVERTGSFRVSPKRRNHKAQPRSLLTDLAQTVMESSWSKFQLKIKKW